MDAAFSLCGSDVRGFTQINGNLQLQQCTIYGGNVTTNLITVVH